MIKFKGIGINLILGVLMGILFSTMIMVEGYVILASKMTIIKIILLEVL